MNGHQQQQESSAFTTTTTSSTSTLLESLGQVDLSALKREPAASYDRLLETARMISALDVGKDLATVKDRDQHEATLRKLLQVSQTIIECLLVKGGASESKNDINAYQNNLRQENAKLRKLLSLQQKAIAFRRANLWTASDNSSRGCEDEDVSTSAAVDVSLLPEDSTVSSANKLFLQCIYCPKIFADASSFAKHISLRHLSSSIDDGLPKSLSSSGDNNNSSSNSFMQRLQLQYQKVLEMKEAAASAAAAGNKSNDGNAEVINRLQMEIGQLKEKLAATEQALDHADHFQKKVPSHLQIW